MTPIGVIVEIAGCTPSWQTLRLALAASRSDVRVANVLRRAVFVCARLVELLLDLDQLRGEDLS